MVQQQRALARLQSAAQQAQQLLPARPGWAIDWQKRQHTQTRGLPTRGETSTSKTEQDQLSRIGSSQVILASAYTCRSAPLASFAASAATSLLMASRRSVAACSPVLSLSLSPEAWLTQPFRARALQGRPQTVGCTAPSKHRCLSKHASAASLLHSPSSGPCRRQEACTRPECRRAGREGCVDLPNSISC